jgi:hypothetical protein
MSSASLASRAFVCGARDDTPPKSEQQPEENQMAYELATAPLLVSRTVSLCTENEWTTGANQYERRYRERVIKQLHRCAAHFGFSLQALDASVS